MSKQRSLLLFEQAIKSEATKTAYKYHLEKFRDWTRIKNYDGLLQAPPKQIQELIEDYVMHLKKSISPNSIPVYFAPIELFYVMNDVNVNFKRIRKMFPDKVKKGNERGYTHEEIRQILKNAKTARHRALVLLFASSACRLGAIPGMKLKHLSKIEESYCIMIYEGDKEEDFVFTTPEATIAIDSYLAERRKDGEYLDAKSPKAEIIAQGGEYFNEYKANAPIPEKVKLFQINGMPAMGWDSGLRKSLVIDSEGIVIHEEDIPHPAQIRVIDPNNQIIYMLKGNIPLEQMKKIISDSLS